MSLHEPIKGLVGYNVQKVLPAVYDDSLSYYELLAKVQEKMGELIQLANELNVDVSNVVETVENISDIPELEQQVQALQEAADTIQGTLDALPSYEEFVSLSQQVTRNESDITTKIPWPVLPFSKYGSDGQVLRTNGNGYTQWQNPIVPTDTQAETYITAWLNDHPEATTTVQDNSLTGNKFVNDTIPDSKLVQTGGVLQTVNNIITDTIKTLYKNNLVVAYVDNAYVNATNGTLVQNQPNYFATDYIPVVEGVTYKSNAGRNWAWYDSSKTYISGSTGVGIQSGTTAPQGAAYIRFSVNKTYDGISTPEYLYFTSVDNYNSREIFGNDLSNFLVGTNFPNNIMVQTYNDNAYVNATNGTLYTNQPNYFATDYIPVVEGVTYKSNKGRYWAWYDSSKTYISGTTGVGIQSGTTAPQGAAYIRFSVNKTADGISTPEYLYFTSVDDYGYADIMNFPVTDVVRDVAANLDYVTGTNFPDNLITQTYNDNAYVNATNGTLVQNQPNYFATDYIPVVEGIEYKSNAGRNWAWYDSSKTYISGTTGVGIQSGTTAPQGAAYIRFSVNKTADGISTPEYLYFTSVDNYSYADIVNFPITDIVTEIISASPTSWTFGKTVNWLGDSIVDGQDFDEIVCNTLNITKLTTDGVDGGINGSTISLKGDGTNIRHALCERYSVIPSNADITIVSCGTNDFQYAWAPIGSINDADDGTSNTTFYGALKALCKGLIDKFPTKVICFTTPIKRAQAFTNGDGGVYTQDDVPTNPFSKNKYGLTLGDYANIIKEVCALYSIPVLDLYNESLLNPSLQSQAGMFDSVGTHPNVQGQKIMARRVCGWLASLEYNIS